MGGRRSGASNTLVGKLLQPVDVLKVALERDQRKEREKQARQALDRHLKGKGRPWGKCEVMSGVHRACIEWATVGRRAWSWGRTSKGSPVNSSPASLRYERSGEWGDEGGPRDERGGEQQRGGARKLSTP